MCLTQGMQSVLMSIISFCALHYRSCGSCYSLYMYFLIVLSSVVLMALIVRSTRKEKGGGFHLALHYRCRITLTQYSRETFSKRAASFPTGDFRVAFCLCFKASPSVKPFIRKLVLFLCKWTKIPYERLRTRTRFETEVKGNSEITY